MQRLYAGIDIGGTAIKAGLLTRSGAVLISGQSPTRAKKGPHGVLEDALGLIGRLLESIGADWQAVDGIGMGVPGMVDGTVVTEATNLGWGRLELGQALAELTPLPLRLANDADAAALGEIRVGAAKGLRSAFLLTLGTGLGGGIILDGHIYSGHRGFGGEIGHMSLVSGGRVCSCGRRGCAEQYLSATALVKEAKRACRRYPDSTLLKLPSISAKEIFDSSDSDSCCAELVEQYTARLSELCLDIANAFRPEAILLGGGVARAGEKLTAPVQQALNRFSFARAYAPPIPVLPAALGNDAGFIGAACLWL